MISCTSMFSNKVGVQERFGRPKGGKRNELGSQSGVQIDQKSMSKIDRNFDRFLGAQEAGTKFSRSSGECRDRWSGGRGAAPPRYLTMGKYHRFEESKKKEYLE